MGRKMESSITLWQWPPRPIRVGLSFAIALVAQFLGRRLIVYHTVCGERESSGEVYAGFGSRPKKGS